MDNFKFIYKILSALEKSMDLEEYNLACISPETLNISEERWNKYMEMLTNVDGSADLDSDDSVFYALPEDYESRQDGLIKEIDMNLRTEQALVI